MKYFTALFFILLLSACNVGPDTDEIPEDLSGKKEFLKEKQAELKELDQLITQLKAEIEELDPNRKEKSRRLVTTQPIERKDFKRLIEIQATVQSDDVVMASSETGGRVVDMSWKEGQIIRKGQLVATIDMESVNKQIAELEKSLELAVEVFDRQKRLWDQNIGSEIQFLQAKNNKERLEKGLETVRFQLTKAKVFAPISGVVEMVFTKAGEMAAPGAPILQILNTDKVKVVADVPENYLGKVNRGDLVSIHFPALDKKVQGRVSLLGRTINPGNRTFTVEVNLSNYNGLLKPNLLATMLISDFEQDDAVVIPLEIVQQEVTGKYYVFVKSDGEEGPAAKKVYIQTGESYKNEIIVTSGLEGGEDLIVDGARGLAENELIEIRKKQEGES